jgi:D-apionolactonase
VVYAKADYPQPWFDEGGGLVYPVYHVIRGIAAAAGLPQLTTEVSNGSAVQAIAYRRDGGVILWLANLTAEPQRVKLAGLPAARGRIARLDLDTFATAVTDPDSWAATADGCSVDALDLGAHAVARIEVTG